MTLLTRFLVIACLLLGVTGLSAQDAVERRALVLGLESARWAQAKLRRVAPEDLALLTRELPVDLAPLMEGELLDVSLPGAPTRIFQRGGRQLEAVSWAGPGEFRVEWVGNNRYLLYPTSKVSDEATDYLSVIVYAVTGQRFKFISFDDDLSSVKGQLAKVDPLPTAATAVLFQTELNRSYLDPASSPLKPLEREVLQARGGHDFFPVDSAYRIVTTLEPVMNGDTIQMPTSAGYDKLYRVYGYLNFPLRGEEVRMTVYQSLRKGGNPEYRDHLFLPFRDGTTGKETYGGGRYLDLYLPRTEDRRIVVDFNHAYQPYCAYTTGYACPLPPEENTLPVRVEAGVKHVDLGGHK